MYYRLHTMKSQKPKRSSYKQYLFKEGRKLPRSTKYYHATLNVDSDDNTSICASSDSSDDVTNLTVHISSDRDSNSDSISEDISTNDGNSTGGSEVNATIQPDTINQTL